VAVGSDVRVEAVLLTGGSSRRMGRDKATLPVGGLPMACRIAGALSGAGCLVTVLGREALPGHAFLADADPGMGVMAALSRYEPWGDSVFVAACDLARFDPRLVALLAEAVGGASAAVPVIDGRPQPVCALYDRRAMEALPRLVAAGETRLSRWLDAIEWVPVGEDRFAATGLDPRCALGANTPEELTRLLGGDTGGGGSERPGAAQQQRQGRQPGEEAH
jgi:molybdopterin-guanine dinucleotide biosynthesis protein A